MAIQRAQALDPELIAYLAAHVAPGPDAVQQRLIDATEQRTGHDAKMQIGADQAVWFEILTRAMGVRSALEIGTFTGYSALAIARGLGPEGTLLCCDVSETWTEIAREHWELAGLADRIELRIGPALDTLAGLDPEQIFDLVFIDADKPNYLSYLEAVLPHLTPHGVVLVDNTLWSRRVLEHPESGRETDSDTIALRAFNDAVTADDRLRSVIVPIGDGVTMIQLR
jgi:caffeoyl-CoA O-methyltransferase